MECSIPGLPVHHQLLEFTQTHVHRVNEAIQPSHSPVTRFSSCLQFFPASRSFQTSQFFPSGSQSIGVSASTSVLPINIQDWFPLGWAGWISLQSKGLSRVFSNTTVQNGTFVKTEKLGTSQASPVAQLVKNLPAMWETWVQSLGWEDPLEKGKTAHFSILV